MLSQTTVGFLCEMLTSRQEGSSSDSKDDGQRGSAANFNLGQSVCRGDDSLGYSLGNSLGDPLADSFSDSLVAIIIMINFLDYPVSFLIVFASSALG